MQTKYHDGRMKLITGLNPNQLAGELAAAASEANQIESMRMWQEEKDRYHALDGQPDNRAGRRRVAAMQRKSARPAKQAKQGTGKRR